jgi:FtsZ-binding cell division protein ZapB
VKNKPQSTPGDKVPSARKPRKIDMVKEQTYLMPQEVREWIERANSTIQHLRGKVENLTTENKELKSYRQWSEHRILRSEKES